MCGIFGCALKSDDAAKVALGALERLEYRGYDSAGIATIHRNQITLKKDRGKIAEIHKLHELDKLPGHIGVGHTRWATHGTPNRENAHPHVDCSARIAVVHNGIIENFQELKAELENRGHVFRSKTDTEVIPHLIEEGMKPGLSFLEAAKAAVKRLEGSYAIAVVCADDIRHIFVARKGSPVYLGASDNGVYVSSDIPALLPLTNKVTDMNDGEAAILSADGFEIHLIEDWSLVKREPKIRNETFEAAKKEGFPHYMLKEIYEQPQTLKNAILIQDKYLELLAEFLDRSRDIYLVASGTSYNACVAASYMFNSLARLATYPVVASEFIQQYGNAVNIESTVFAVSQSGETADVLRCVDHARDRAATILGLTNVLGSTLTRVARAYVCQQSGPEIGVGATKTFTSQLIVLAQIALKLAKKRGKVSQDEMDDIQSKLDEVPELVRSVILSKGEQVQHLAHKYRGAQCVYFLGRGVSTATALEGRLKLLEIARIPCIAYPAGESKHGPISLIEDGFPVIFSAPKSSTHRISAGNILELKTRGASIIGLIEQSDQDIKGLCDDYIELPGNIPEILAPIIHVIPLQLFAYYMAIERGLDPDKPRNLAKSVTVL